MSVSIACHCSYLHAGIERKHVVRVLSITAGASAVLALYLQYRLERLEQQTKKYDEQETKRKLRNILVLLALLSSAAAVGVAKTGGKS